MTNRFFHAIGYSQILCILLIAGAFSVHAQQINACGTDRPTSINRIWSGVEQWCVERVVDDNSVGVIGYTQLTTDADGALYSIMPEAGTLIHFDDTDNDGLPDTPITLTDSLIRPTGITYHDGALYLTALNMVYRYTLADDTLTTLTDDFPADWTGYPTGNPFVHDGWLYIGAGGDVACTNGRGAVYRMTLDGNTLEPFADGLRAPSSITEHNGQLWVTDTATDKLWPLVEGTDYGACSGNTPDLSPIQFEAGAAPVALTSYTSDLFPYIEKQLLVALRGTGGAVIVTGYAVVAVDTTNGNVSQVLPLNSPHLNITNQRMHIQGSGFYPHLVQGVTVNDAGWVYISSATGQIVALRPFESFDLTP